MLWSESAITTLRDDPTNVAGVGNRLLIRAGYVLYSPPCTYSYPLLARKSMEKIERMSDAGLPWPEIFAHCGIDAVLVDGTRFMVFSDSGEEVVVACPHCRYAAAPDNASAYAKPPAFEDPDTDDEPEEFHTPDRKTIAAVAEFTSLPSTSQMKSLVMVADNKPALVLVRGDHYLSYGKLLQAAGASEVRQATAPEIVEWFGADPGSLGPVGINHPHILADLALEGRRNMITGANKNDFHLRNVTPGRDFRCEYADLRRVNEGDACAVCGSELKLHKATEIARKPDGIWFDRVLHAAAEANHDADGLCLPAPIAPFTLIITPVNTRDAALLAAARKIYEDCQSRGIDTLYDDRDERPGVKFKDADLIGIPWRITIGKKLANGFVELYDRKKREPREVPVEEATRELVSNPL